MVINIILLITAYLLGSIPSAVWIGKRFYGVDVREHGSKNAGATNTLRVLGPKAALPVFIMDLAKGFAAVQLYRLSPDALTGWVFYIKLALVAAVVLGHIFPVFAGFRGGKGVATLTGSVLAINPPAVLLCILTFVLVLSLTRYVSLSSMTAGVMLPVYLRFVFGEKYPPLLIFACAVSVLLIWTHRRNIGRLLNGTESKIRFVRK
ncbi:MAG: glycerol-3-phosphate 1-O-acyltransferase PlsY [Alistipes sp.]|nr:glycerol-3-phosphate 1-O-acyltransferase PlsY [Alistipes sp.]